jgi:hypothetical protein
MKAVKLEIINRIANKFEAEAKMKQQKENFHYYLSFLIFV